MISQEKVKGWLVYRSSFMGKDIIETVELSLIPEVWILYIAEYTKPVWDNYTDFLDPAALIEYEISIKEKLNFEEIRQSLDKKEKSDELDNIENRFLNFQNQCLAIWEKFCEKYQSLMPEQIQEAKKYCGFDSVTVPVVPSAPIDYVLAITVWNKSGNVWSRVAILGPLSSPTDFDSTLIKNTELVNLIIRSVGKNDSGGRKLEIKESKEYFTQNPDQKYKALTIPELTAFVEAFNAGGAQAALTSPLVRPDLFGDGMSSLFATQRSVASVKVPMVAPAGSVSAFIQGEWAGIQGSVAYEKRDTTLTENKKQTDIQKELLEESKKQTRFLEQVARNTGTIEQNTQGFNGVNLKPVEKAERKRIVYEEIQKEAGVQVADTIIAGLYARPNNYRDIAEIKDPNLEYEDSHRKTIKKNIKVTELRLKKSTDLIAFLMNSKHKDKKRRDSKRKGKK